MHLTTLGIRQQSTLDTRVRRYWSWHTTYGSTSYGVRRGTTWDNRPRTPDAENKQGSSPSLCGILNCWRHKPDMQDRVRWDTHSLTSSHEAAYGTMACAHPAMVRPLKHWPCNERRGFHSAGSTPHRERRHRRGPPKAGPSKSAGVDGRRTCVR